MKKMIFAVLCAVPSALCAQHAKLIEISVPDEPAQAAEVSPSAVAAKPAATPAAGDKTAAAKPKAEPAAKPKAEPAAKMKPAPAVTAPAPAPVKSDREKRIARDYAAKYLPVLPGALSVLPTEKSPVGGFTVLKRHQIIKGDTLWDLSQKYYKDPFMWGRIYNANFSSVSDPDRIYPNGELVIPDITELLIPYRVPATDVTEVTEVGEIEPSDYQGIPSVYMREQLERMDKASMPGEIEPGIDRNLLSEEMPEDQREWLDRVKIVPDSWKEDGVITARLKNEDPFLEDGLSVEGTILEISMSGDKAVRPGDYLGIYLRGGYAQDKAGRRLGRELQPVGMAEVFTVTGSVVKARVLDATTGIYKGYIVVKK